MKLTYRNPSAMAEGRARPRWGPDVVLAAVRERPPSIMTKGRPRQRSTVGPEPEVHRPPPPQPWAGWPDGWETAWGYAATDQGGYLHRVSTVMTCVDLNSRQLGSFPVYGRMRDTGRPFTLPAWHRNPEPALYASWSEFMRAAMNAYQLNGEVILWATARDSDGYPARFVVLNPLLVNVEPDGEGGKRFSLGGEELDPRDVLHVPYQTLAGRVRGIGPLEWVGRSLVSAAALERYAADLAESGVPALLTHPATLTKTQAEDAKNQWMESRRGDPASPAVISGGFTYTPVSLSPRDMALLDLRVFDEQRIASAFGVPPFLIGLPQPGGLTYSNTSQLFDFHWKATLRPMASAFASALSAWTLSRNRFLEFDRDEYVRPGLEERARAYQTLHTIQDPEGHPAITVDEVRAAERFTPNDPPLISPSSIPGVPQ